MTQPQPYALILTPPARRVLTDRLPEGVATAVIDFLTTALITEPCRVGQPLRGDLAVRMLRQYDQIGRLEPDRVDVWRRIGERDASCRHPPGGSRIKAPNDREGERDGR